jgi:OmpA-OmpF porin, OOP family
VLTIFSFSGAAQVSKDFTFPLANQRFNEQNPVLSPDGKTLYFTITNHTANIGGIKDPGDIWFSRLLGEQWSAPVHAGPAINNRSYNAVAGISADGKQLFLHGHYDGILGSAKTQGISVSKDNGLGWSSPENISIPYYMNKSPLLSGMVTDDGEVFVFSAETYGSFGVEDLYVSFQRNGKWTEPKNLGPSVNTVFQELSPALSPDRMTLYFSAAKDSEASMYMHARGWMIHGQTGARRLILVRM